MNKKIILGIMVIVIVISTVFLFLNLRTESETTDEVSISDAPKKITFVTGDKAFPPHSMGDGSEIDWERPGVTIELLKSLEKKLDVEIHIERFPWKRALKIVELNESDGIFHASFDSERLKIGVYPMKEGKPDADRQIMSSSYFLYKRKVSPLQWDGENFSYLSGPIGIILGYAIGADLERMGVQIEETDSQLNNLRKLSSADVAGIADLEKLTDLQIRLHPEEFKDIVKVFPPLRSKPYYLMLSKKFVKENPQLSEDIWDTIKIIHESGEYDEIYAKYVQE